MWTRMLTRAGTHKKIQTLIGYTAGHSIFQFLVPLSPNVGRLVFMLVYCYWVISEIWFYHFFLPMKKKGLLKKKTYCSRGISTEKQDVKVDYHFLSFRITGCSSNISNQGHCDRPVLMDRDRDSTASRRTKVDDGYRLHMFSKGKSIPM